MLPGGEFTSHDLRRTGASEMQRLGVPPAVVEACLNHVERSRMAKTYQQDDLLSQRLDAFMRLGASLDELVPASATAHLEVV